MIQKNKRQNDKGLVEQARSLFEFLREYQKKKEKTVRDLRDYDYHKFEIPLAENLCYFGDEDDPWLTVKLPRLPEPPEPPSWLGKWLLTRGFDFRNECSDVPIPDDALTFAASQKNEYRNWRNRWLNWAEKTKLCKRVRSFYKELYDIEQRLEREGETLEFLWGNGVVSWALDSHSVFHPLLITRIKLLYDQKDESLRIEPEERLTQFELDFLYGVSTLVGIAEKFKRATDGSQKGKPHIGAWQSDELENVYERFWKIAGVPGEIYMTCGEEVSPPSHSGVPAIYNGPVLILRKRRTGFARFFADAAAVIAETFCVPPLMERLLREKSQLSNSVGSETPAPSRDEDFMFPLPSNEEQRKVVIKLTKEAGVTLLGPPGTGKSHTICNIICHYLSQGKRILVTAWIGRPLSVIKDMMPEAIRPLCIILAGRDVSVLRELEASVSAMENRIVDVDIHSEEAKAKKLRNKLESIRGEIAAVRKELNDARKAETRKYILEQKPISAQELAKWLRQNEDRLGWIPDEIQPEEDPPLSQAEFLEFFELSTQIPLNVRQVLEQARPNPDKLLDASELEELFSEIREIEGQVPRELLEDPQLGDLKEEDLSRLIQEVSSLEETMNPNNTPPWKVNLRKLLKEHDAYFGEFRDFARELRHKVDRFVVEKRKLESLNIELVNNQTPRKELLHKVERLLNKLKPDRAPSFLIRRLHWYRHLSNSFLINNAKPLDRSDWEAVQAYLKYLSIKDEIYIYWAQKTKPIRHMPELSSQGNLDVQIRKYCEEIENEISVGEKHWTPLVAQLQKVLGAQVSNWRELNELSHANLCALKAKLENLRGKLRFNNLRKRLENLKDHLVECSRSKKASPFADELLQMLKSRDLSQWDSIRRRLMELQRKEEDYERMKELAGKLRKVAPQLCNRILMEPSEDLRRRLENILEAWEWRRAESWLTNLRSADAVKSERNLERLREDERRVKMNLITTLAWMNLAKSITEEERKSLKSWAQHMRKIGKGKGKYAQKYQRYAQEEMQSCRNAVPVWVMPLPLVVENFVPGPDPPFDLVIVDESSQCDITGIAALSLGKQVLIVGDDKQIAPYGIGIDESEIDELIRSYLKNFPRREQFHPRQSLYDFAVREFPGLIGLKEHFRSVPPIIEFSNRLAYNGDIKPVKTLRPDSLEPLRAVYVKEGYREYPAKLNKPEAENLVETLLECCSDRRYRGKTMGVISLLGDDQARYIMERLYQELDLSEIRQRRIVCGNAYHFQGDERDVVFISVVDALDSERSRERLAVFNRIEHLREINVAASRAREQCWVFYSTKLDYFHPEDFRKMLIQHYETFREERVPVQALETLQAKCESPFEKDVLRDLGARGYEIIPQVPVGGYRIDLVVYGREGLKVGVECDGDQYHDDPEEIERDYIRQTALERWGWTIFRIRGSEYYRDPDSTVEKLCKRLNEIGIIPTRS